MFEKVKALLLAVPLYLVGVVMGVLLFEAVESEVECQKDFAKKEAEAPVLETGGCSETEAKKTVLKLDLNRRCV